MLLIIDAVCDRCCFQAGRLPVTLLVRASPSSIDAACSSSDASIPAVRASYCWFQRRCCFGLPAPCWFVLVQIFMDVPLSDPLYKMKMELLHKHSKQPISKEDRFSSSKHSFIIKEVKSSCRKGRGLPQSLRAFARVLAVLTCEELAALANEASQGDGRLARRPLKNMGSEIQAHNLLLSEFRRMMKCRDAKVEELETSSVPYCCSLLSGRRKMAIDLYRGEIRVLQSASAWITSYCTSLSDFPENARQVGDGSS